MLHCFFTIRTDESEKLFEDIQNKKLDLENWEHLHNFNLDRYRGTTELELSPEQERLVELVEEFDKQMREKYGEEQQSTEDEDTYAKKNIDIEPKIGGISLKKKYSTNIQINVHCRRFWISRSWSLFSIEEIIQPRGFCL